MAVKEERKSACKIINIKPCFNSCINISNTVCQCKSYFLNSITSCFPNMIATDTDSIP